MGVSIIEAVSAKIFHDCVWVLGDDRKLLRIRELGNNEEGDKATTLTM